jgi:hypothetical protein
LRKSDREQHHVALVTLNIFQILDDCRLYAIFFKEPSLTSR